MIVILISVVIAKLIIIINDTGNNKNGDSINIGTDLKN